MSGRLCNEVVFKAGKPTDSLSTATTSVTDIQYGILDLRAGDIASTPAVLLLRADVPFKQVANLLTMDAKEALRESSKESDFSENSKDRVAELPSDGGIFGKFFSSRNKRDAKEDRDEVEVEMDSMDSLTARGRPFTLWFVVHSA